MLREETQFEDWSAVVYFAASHSSLSHCVDCFFFSLCLSPFFRSLSLPPSLFLLSSTSFPS